MHTQKVKRIEIDTLHKLFYGHLSDGRQFFYLFRTSINRLSTYREISSGRKPKPTP